MGARGYEYSYLGVGKAGLGLGLSRGIVGNEYIPIIILKKNPVAPGNYYHGVLSFYFLLT